MVAQGKIFAGKQCCATRKARGLSTTVLLPSNQIRICIITSTGAVKGTEKAGFGHSQRYCFSRLATKNSLAPVSVFHGLELFLTVDKPVVSNLRGGRVPAPFRLWLEVALPNATDHPQAWPAKYFRLFSKVNVCASLFSDKVRKSRKTLSVATGSGRIIVQTVLQRRKIPMNFLIHARNRCVHRK